MVVITQVGATSPAASIPWQDGRARVGILSLGSPGPADDGPALRYLQSGLRKWLESSPAPLLEVARIESSLEMQKAQSEALRERLETLSRRLVVLASGEFTESVRREAGQLSQAAEALWAEEGRNLTLGPQWQRLLVANALYRWRVSERDDAESLLQQAARLEPDGSLKPAIGWDLEAAPMLASFFDAVERAQGAEPRSCRVEIEEIPPGVQVSWNGFDLRGRRSWHAIPGIPARIVARGGRWQTQVIDFTCERPGRKRLGLSLQARGTREPVDALSLLQVSERLHVRSLVLVEPAADRFRLYLYTPAVAIDEIPLTHPLTFQAVLSRGADADLPISTAAFSALLEKHRLAPLRLALGSEATATSPAPDWIGARVSARQTERRWYNSPTFWVIVGAVALGGVAAYLTFANHADATQRGIPVRVE
jgi:hypothetical protein